LPVIVGATAGASLAGRAIDTTGSSEEKLEKRVTGGLTEYQFNQLAAASAEKGVSWNNKEGMREIFGSLGFSAENFESVYSHILELGSSFDELANSALAASVAQEAYVDSFAANIIENNEELKESEYAN